MEPQRRLVTKTFPIVRMDCPTCIPAIENEVKRVKGVVDARGSYMTKTIKVVYDPEMANVQEIEASIERVGYQIAYKKYPGILSRIGRLVKGQRMSNVEAISDSNFKEKVLDSSIQVAVLFMSPTCPTCRILKPIYAEAGEKLRGKTELYEMDIASSETWRQYNVLTIPTMLVFKDGQVKTRLTSLFTKSHMERALSA